MHIKDGGDEPMAIAVDVAKDPKAIKSKFIGNFTKRQVICFGAAAVVGIPFYLSLIHI